MALRPLFIRGWKQLSAYKRLKEKYPDDYKGGILAIDELDATMYPASQKELLAVLRKYSSRLNLQVFFTTHSLSLLESVDNLRVECSKKKETYQQVQLIYLKRVDNNIVINDKATFRNIMLNLQVMQGEKKAKRKILVYSEDKEGILFAKHLLKGNTSMLNFVDISIPCTILTQLSAKKIPAFNAPESIVIVDGDVRNEKTQMKEVSASDNILILPSKMSPERFTATFLHDLSDTESLWETIGEGYSKQVCFKDYPYKEIMDDRIKAKEWFRRESVKWGRNASGVLTPLFKKYKAEREEFVSSFMEMIKRYNI